MTVAQHNTQAEENVLGAMLLAPHAIDACTEVLTAEDFYRSTNAVIFQTIAMMHAAGMPVDALTLSHELTKTSHSIPDSTLAGLAALVPAASNAGHYASIVRETAVLRRLLHAGQEIQKLATERPGELDELLAKAEAALTAATSTNQASASPFTEGLAELIAELRQAYTTGIPMSGLLTGYTDLDKILLGLWPGQLLLIAARPAQGKSTIGLNIAENFADRGVPSLFATLEMSKRELQIRSLSRAAKIDGLKLQAGQINEEEAKRLKTGIDIVTGRTNLHIEDNGGLTVQKLSATASRYVRKEKIQAVFVDYIQLMREPGVENRSVEVGAISRGLKQLARRLDIPVIAMSQMNRSIETRAEKRPTLSDLRESGSLEQDADVVLFLHDETAYDPDKTPSGETEVIVAKNRRGPTDTAKLLYTRRLSSFINKTQTGSLREAEAA